MRYTPLPMRPEDSPLCSWSSLYLPKQLAPSSYALHLTTDMAAPQYAVSGSLEIGLVASPSEPTPCVVLSSLGIDIQHVRLRVHDDDAGDAAPVEVAGAATRQRRCTRHLLSLVVAHCSERERGERVLSRLLATACLQPSGCTCYRLLAGRVAHVDEELQQVTLQFPSALPLRGVLVLQFSYQLQEALDGFYRSSFIGESPLWRAALLMLRANRAPTRACAAFPWRHRRCCQRDQGDGVDAV